MQFRFGTYKLGNISLLMFLLTEHELPIK